MSLRATTEMSELFANRNDAYEHGCTLYLRYLPKEVTDEIPRDTNTNNKILFELLVDTAQKMDSKFDIDVFELPVRSKFNPNAPVYVPGKMNKHHSASLLDLRSGGSPPHGLTPPESKRSSLDRVAELAGKPSTPPAKSPIVSSDKTFDYFQDQE
jgi:hypothetical protein